VMATPIQELIAAGKIIVPGPFTNEPRRPLTITNVTVRFMDMSNDTSVPTRKTKRLLAMIDAVERHIEAAEDEVEPIRYHDFNDFWHAKRKRMFDRIDRLKAERERLYRQMRGN
jgi:hypothetical protein